MNIIELAKQSDMIYREFEDEFARFHGLKHANIPNVLFQSVRPLENPGIISEQTSRRRIGTGLYSSPEEEHNDP